MKKIFTVQFIICVLPLFYALSLNAQITLSNEIKADLFGGIEGMTSTLSRDGKTIAVSQFDLEDKATVPGFVNVYKNENGSWLSVGQKIQGESPLNDFGKCLSLSANGEIIAISEPGDSGFVRVYELVNNVWIQKGKTIVGPSVNSSFGFTSLSLSSDGLTLAVGAPYYNNYAGMVSCFEFINNNWIPKGPPLTAYAVGDFAGFKVDLSDDGSILVVGLPYNSDFSDNAGKIMSFHYSGSDWMKLAEDLVGNSYESLGYSLSISGNGNMLAVGAFSDSTYEQGNQVTMYELQANKWVKKGDKIHGVAINDRFGSELDLNKDGSFLIAGCRRQNKELSAQGDARIYRYLDQKWSQIGDQLSGAKAGDDNGVIAVSISSSGAVAAVGAMFDNNGMLPNENSGHVRIYDNSAASTTRFLEGKQVKVYPNPTNGIVSWDTTASFMIIDMSGKILLQGEGNSTDLSNYPAGNYNLQLSSQTYLIQKK